MDRTLDYDQLLNRIDNSLNSMLRQGMRAQDMLLYNAKKFKFTVEEIRDTERNLKYWMSLYENVGGQDEKS